MSDVERQPECDEGKHDWIYTTKWRGFTGWYCDHCGKLRASK